MAAPWTALAARARAQLRRVSDEGDKPVRHGKVAGRHRVVKQTLNLMLQGVTAVFWH
jgi:hypothetical protein